MKSYLRIGLAGFVMAALSVSMPAMAIDQLSAGDAYVSGNFGVGTAAPNRALHVFGNTAGVHAMNVQNFSTGSAGLRFQTTNSLIDLTAQNGNLTFFDLLTSSVLFFVKSGGDVGIGTGNPQAKFHVVGDVLVGTTMSSQIVEIRGAGNDLAETFAMSSENLEPGMVVSIDPQNPGKLMQSYEAYDHKVAGIISGAGDLHTGINLGDMPANDAERSIALTGRVWCWVDTENTGAVNPGDLLTTSPTPGHAMKVLDYQRGQGATIGKAMTALESGTGLVLVLVTLH